MGERQTGRDAVVFCNVVESYGQNPNVGNFVPKKGIRANRRVDVIPEKRKSWRVGNFKYLNRSKQVNKDGFSFRIKIIPFILSMVS